MLRRFIIDVLNCSIVETCLVPFILLYTYIFHLCSSSFLLGLYYIFLWFPLFPILLYFYSIPSISLYSPAPLSSLSFVMLFSSPQSFYLSFCFPQFLLHSLLLSSPAILLFPLFPQMAPRCMHFSSVPLYTTLFSPCFFTFPDRPTRNVLV